MTVEQLQTKKDKAKDLRVFETGPDQFLRGELDRQVMLQGDPR